MVAMDPAVGLARLRYVIAAQCLLGAALGFEAELKAGFRPDQPRVPAGNSDGGRWSGEGGASIFHVGDEEDDAETTRNVAGRLEEAAPDEIVRLDLSEARMRAAVDRVRQLDPKWKPTPSLFETFEGQIGANEATAKEALDRLFELQRVGVGPGPYAVESQPARNSSRRWTADEVRENNRIGRIYGCNTCGTRDPGTRNGNFVGDHQDPTALNSEGRPQRVFPQCLSCSGRQGAWITNYGKKP